MLLLTINVSVVYMVQYVVVLRGQIHKKVHFKGVGALKIETFLGPEMATSEA